MTTIKHALLTPTATGATAATRYMGGIASGAPVSGTFAVGDFVIDQTGIVWICTVAGTPGTWVDGSSSGRELASAESSTTQTGITTVTDITGLSITFTVANRPVWVEADLPFVYPTTNAAVIQVLLTDSDNTVKRLVSTPSLAANNATDVHVLERFATPGTYTRKVRMLRFSGTGTANNNVDSTTVATIRAITA